MNILYVSAEVAPFAKTGGLGDVAAALPRQLARHGHDVRVFVPFYSKIATEGRIFEAVPGVRDIDVRLGSHQYRFSLYQSKLPGSDLQVYFVHCPVLYHRPGIYTADPDEHLRFLLLCRAALESAQRLQFAPDIVHCNDWQTGLLPLMLKTQYGWDKLFARAKTVFTIHNLQYQGVFRADVLPDTGMADSAHLFHQEQLREGRLNFMVTGILYADAITTVSPTYSREIQGPEQGAGIDGLLRQRSSALVGILNGVDYDEWSPETDKHIPQHYSAADLELKARNKEHLLRSMGLPGPLEVPVAGVVSRLAGQKGLDLFFEAAPQVLNRHETRLVLLGSGESRYEEFFKQLQRAFPRKVCFYSGYNNGLAHMIEAGADMFLMPSRYEPCGLNQMYSLRYGTVPIVHKTGGLADTVQLWDPGDRTGNGIAFDHFTPEGLGWAIEAALGLYRDSGAWRALMANGMAANFSWDAQGKLYEELYQRLASLGRR